MGDIFYQPDAALPNLVEQPNSDARKYHSELRNHHRSYWFGKAQVSSVSKLSQFIGSGTDNLAINIQIGFYCLNGSTGFDNGNDDLITHLELGNIERGIVF